MTQVVTEQRQCKARGGREGQRGRGQNHGPGCGPTRTVQGKAEVEEGRHNQDQVVARGRGEKQGVSTWFKRPF